MHTIDVSKINVIIEMLNKIENILHEIKQSRKEKEVIETLEGIKYIENIICKQIIIEKIRAYLSSIKTFCNKISEYNNYLSKILSIRNAIDMDEKLVYIDVTFQNTRNIRKTIHLINNNVLKEIFRIYRNIEDLEKCYQLSLPQKIIEKYGNIMSMLKYLEQVATQQAQHNIDQLEKFTHDLALTINAITKGTAKIKDYEKLAKYIVGHAATVRYIIFQNTLARKYKVYELAELIKQINSYLLENHLTLLQDAIKNINIEKHIKNTLISELNKIYSNKTYSPLYDSQITNFTRNLCNENKQCENIINNIIKAFITGNKNYINYSNQVLSILNDLEQIILNLILSVLLLENVEDALCEVYELIDDNIY